MWGITMQRLLAILILAASLALPAHAQDKPSPETMQAAQELAAIMTSDTVEQLSRAMTAQIWPTIEQQVVGKIDAATIADMRAAFEKTLTKFTGEVMKNAPEVYARHFTAQELRDMVAFYKSPTGVKALHEMPKVMADVSMQMAPRLQALQSELNQRMVAIMREHGYKK
jgi:uncharacterized protein